METTSTERDALVFSESIFGALVRHELQQHSDKEDTPKPMEMEYIFTQFVLDKMEERYDIEAEAKLTALKKIFIGAKQNIAL